MEPATGKPTPGKREGAAPSHLQGDTIHAASKKCNGPRRSLGSVHPEIGREVSTAGKPVSVAHFADPLNFQNEMANVISGLRLRAPGTEPLPLLKEAFKRGAVP